MTETTEVSFLLLFSMGLYSNYNTHFFGATRLVSVGNLEAAVSLLLSTPPESSYFYVNALRAVALSSAVSRSLHELAVKVSISGACMCSGFKIQILINIQEYS